MKKKKEKKKYDTSYLVPLGVSVLTELGSIKKEDKITAKEVGHKLEDILQTVSKKKTKLIHTRVPVENFVMKEKQKIVEKEKEHEKERNKTYNARIEEIKPQVEEAKENRKKKAQEGKKTKKEIRQER